MTISTMMMMSISSSSPVIHVPRETTGQTRDDTQLLNLFPHFNGHFADGPGLAGTRMSPFWISLDLRMMEVVMTTAAIKDPVKSSPTTHQHPAFYGSPNQQCHSTDAVTGTAF